MKVPRAAALSSRVLIVPVACVTAACGEPPTRPITYDPPPVPFSMSEIAWSYINEALDTMQNHSVKRYEIEWPSFRTQVYQTAIGAQTASDTYDAIREALSDLGDDHSYFLEPNQRGGGTTRVNHPPEGSRLRDNVGYLKMPAFSSFGMNRLEMEAYAAEYHGLLRSIDTTGMCGWIIDLRENTGGNLWPMIAGVGPVVGEDTLGSFVTPDSVKTFWSYSDGGSWNEGREMIQVQGVPYVLERQYPTVAVLTGSNTASSGEALVVSFRGRPKTRVFGQGTWGVSTANSGFELSDGALMLLTIALMADRTGHLYGSVIEPDVLVEGPATFDEDTDPVIIEAKLWLATDGDCAGN